MAKATNVTTFDATIATGTVVDAGVIKSTEKLWTDTYTFSSALTTGTTIDIAVIPKNSRVTSIKLIFPSLSTTASGTGTTISLGVRTGIQTGSTMFLNAGEAYTGITSLEANSPTGLGVAMTGSTNRIYLQIGRVATDTTSGTIYSLVRYT